eukprot:11399-Heterococcus_DN1.PRE.3
MQFMRAMQKPCSKGKRSCRSIRSSLASCLSTFVMLVSHSVCVKEEVPTLNRRYTIISSTLEVHEALCRSYVAIAGLPEKRAHSACFLSTQFPGFTFGLHTHTVSTI